MSIARAFALNASARRCPGARRGPDRTLTWLTLEAISQMAFPQEHENAKTRNNLKVFFFVVSCFRGFVIVRVYETRSRARRACNIVQGRELNDAARQFPRTTFVSDTFTACELPSFSFVR